MRVAVCLPSHGAAFRDHEKCLARLRVAKPDWLFLELPGMPCIDIGRASLAESALREKADVLLWLDSDMVFNVSTCDEIVAQAMAQQAVVGCLYAGKKFGAKPQCAFLAGTGAFTAYEGGSLLEVEAIGFGVVAHPASMLEGVAKKLHLPTLKILDFSIRPWFTTDATGKWEAMHSDDYAFCRRAREAGYRIFADTRQRVGHIGFHTYMLEDAIPLTRAPSLLLQFEDTKKEAAE